MKHTVQSKRPRAGTDPQEESISPDSLADEAAGEATAEAGTPSKLHARDGLAEHQRNPLAPPINITSNG